MLTILWINILKNLKGEKAMKTELIRGEKRMLRLKIEVSVLLLCHNSQKKHFVEFVDRGKTDQLKV